MSSLSVACKGCSKHSSCARALRASRVHSALVESMLHPLPERPLIQTDARVKIDFDQDDLALSVQTCVPAFSADAAV